jgi:hypothetical protein
MAAVGAEVMKSDAAFLLFQEVTEELLHLLTPHISSRYRTRSGLNGRPYGELLFFRHDVRVLKFEQVPFVSSMGRQLHLLRVDWHGKHVVVATSHLESEKEQKSVRLAQLSTTFDILQKTGDPFVFAGDTNLAKRDGHITMPAGVADAWIACGSSPGTEWTWDTGCNKNLGVPFASRCRFDRAYFSSGTLRVDLFTLIGNTILPCGLYPSDHWGILTCFRFH